MATAREEIKYHGDIVPSGLHFKELPTDKDTKLVLVLMENDAAYDTINLMLQLYFLICKFKQKNKDVACEIEVQVRSFDKNGQDHIAFIKAMCAKMHELIPFGCSISFKSFKSKEDIRSYALSKDKVDVDSIQGIGLLPDENFDIVPSQVNLGLPRDPTFYDLKRGIEARYLTKYIHAHAARLGDLSFGFFPGEGFRSRHVEFDKSKVFDNAVIGLILTVRNKMHDFYDVDAYGIIRKKITITPEMMKDTKLIALIETLRLQKIIHSNVSNDEKLTAITRYQETCKESWPSWLARLGIAVAFAAIGLVFAGVGAIVGVYLANRLCKATFFAHHVCVEKVAEEALANVKYNMHAPDQKRVYTL